MSNITQHSAEVLDVCCGSRMFHFNKQNPSVIYNDLRTERHILCDGRELIINPDVNMDFKNLRYFDRTFSVVIFDPPHLVSLGEKSWMAKKYGILEKTWKEDIAAGFAECFRVLKPNGVLIFKWNETQIKTREILGLTNVKPLVGHISGKQANTHWITFLKTMKFP